MDAFYNELCGKFGWLRELEAELNVKKLIEAVFAAGYQTAQEDAVDAVMTRLMADQVVEECRLAEQCWNGDRA